MTVVEFSIAVGKALSGSGCTLTHIALPDNLQLGK